MTMRMTGILKSWQKQPPAICLPVTLFKEYKEESHPEHISTHLSFIFPLTFKSRTEFARFLW